jgi:hypothetical protein
VTSLDEMISILVLNFTEQDGFACRSANKAGLQASANLSENPKTCNSLSPIATAFCSFSLDTQFKFCPDTQPQSFKLLGCKAWYDRLQHHHSSQYHHHSQQHQGLAFCSTTIKAMTCLVHQRHGPSQAEARAGGQQALHGAHQAFSLHEDTTMLGLSTAQLILHH